MKVVWQGVKRDANHVKHFSGILGDYNNNDIIKFYYTPKSPKYIRICQTRWHNNREYTFMVESLKKANYRELDEEQFRNQCPLFESALGEFLLIRKIKYGI